MPSFTLRDTEIHLTKRDILVILGFFVLILAIAQDLRAKRAPARETTIQEQSRSVSRKRGHIQLGDKQYEVVLAMTPEEIQQGLSDREHIGADGMLFVLPSEGKPTFWMYHMKFPLDFIWLDEDSVVDLQVNIPNVAYDAPANEIPTATPSYPVRYVLEVPAGFAVREGISSGMRFQWVSETDYQPWP